MAGGSPGDGSGARRRRDPGRAAGRAQPCRDRRRLRRLGTGGGRPEHGTRAGGDGGDAPARRPRGRPAADDAGARRKRVALGPGAGRSARGRDQRVGPGRVPVGRHPLRIARTGKCDCRSRRQQQRNARRGSFLFRASARCRPGVPAVRAPPGDPRRTGRVERSRLAGGRRRRGRRHGWSEAFGSGRASPRSSRPAAVFCWRSETGSTRGWFATCSVPRSNWP